MKPLRRLAVLAAASAIVLLTGCSDSPTGSSQGTVQIRMTDAPGEFGAVNVVVTEVAIHRANAPDSSGWETIKRDSTQYDLLQLRNGVFATLGIGSVPTGHYTQVRLILGSGSHVVIAGLPVALALSSEARTGVKLNGSWEVQAGETLDLGLDFDAGRSIILTGAGQYLLKPVIRAVAMDQAGAISGRVSAGSQRATITARQGSEIVASAETAADGRFTLSALPVGSYSLVVHAAVSAYRDSTLTGISVRARATTDIGTCALSPAP